ncbi:hypothetical protein ACJMK2_006233, partial [Sinanodonta woodiana]
LFEDYIEKAGKPVKISIVKYSYSVAHMVDASNLELVETLGLTTPTIPTLGPSAIAPGSVVTPLTISPFIASSATSPRLKIVNSSRYLGSGLTRMHPYYYV